MKIFTTIVIALLPFVSAVAQQHPFPGSAAAPAWTEMYRMGPGAPVVLSYYRIQGDTLLGADTWSKLYRYNENGNIAYEGALREDNARDVYFMPADSLQALKIYAFDIAAGDTLYNISCFNGSGWYTDTLRVTTADSLDLNGAWYDRYTLSSLNPERPTPLEWIEGIGSTASLLRHITYVSISGEVRLSCFFNNNGLLYQYSAWGWPGSHTCYAGLEEHAEQSLNVYPNPVQDVLYLPYGDFQHAAYSLTDVAGNTIRSGKLNANTLPVQDLKPGMYRLRIQNSTGVYTAGLIKL
ncbi:MAG: T9SS type A sorting domain-containing protein [Flavobacteriales bacterium]